MKIALVGDVYPGGDLERAVARPVVDVPAYHAADFRIGTLESALSASSVRADKGVLTASPAGARRLKELNLNAVSIAQNHIQDMGPEGITDTIRALDAEGIGHCGAGPTLADARRPVWITRDLCLLSYCRHRALTLNQIAVAAADRPGVAPLTLDSVREDLEKLPPGAQAILVFHWGCEHLWLTPDDNVELARRLLEDDRVALIAGSHPHRAQGYLDHSGKRAYFSLGNFLFSNFHLDRPRRQVVPAELPRRVPVTRLYHCVDKLTYKKWPRVNRVSMMVVFDTQSGSVSHQFVVQDDSQPCVRPVSAWHQRPLGWWAAALSRLTSRSPRAAYRFLFAVHHAVAFWWWRQRIRLTQLRHMGLRTAGGRAFRKAFHRRASSGSTGEQP